MSYVGIDRIGMLPVSYTASDEMRLNLNGSGRKGIRPYLASQVCLVNQREFPICMKNNYDNDFICCVEN